MNISAIKEFPSTLNHDVKNGGRYHESLFRSHQILQKTKDLLKLNTPSEVILEIIEDIESAPATERTIEAI